KYTNAVARYQRNYADALASSRQMKDMLEIDRRFRKLSNMTSRTPAEEAEYQMLSSMFKKYMSASERLDMEVSGALAPSNMEYMLNVNKALLESAKENIYLTVYKSFNNITKAEDAIRVKSSLISNLETNYKAATAKYAQGKLSLNSLKTIELELQKAKIELNTLQTEKKKLLIQFNVILGMPLDHQYSSYVNEAVPETITMKTLQEYIDIAYANNASYKTAKQSFEIKKNEYELITGFYVYETNQKNMSAYIAYNEAKDQFETTEVNIQLQVMNAANSLQNQLTNLEKSKIALDLQERNLQEVKSKYSLGLTTELQVSEANISYYKSQLDYLSAARDTWLTKLNLDLACGIAKNNN
ncbi:MAG TPA: TolC family protein, partial [Patescibacteria group bacterium]|nr:TolC family protein [Patescibacteria group bacterium]